MTILITGVSTRAIAESAARSRRDVITLDFFGDSDQKEIIRNYSLLRELDLPFRVENLIKASDNLSFDSMVYISNLENHPDLVEAVSGQAKILGNSPDTLRRVRDWSLLREFMTVNDIPFPLTLMPGEEESSGKNAGWLMKPVNSGGGSGIKAWEGEKLPDSMIIQRRVEGIPASAGFLANGSDSVVIGMSAQLTGIQKLGADGCRWCGNILPLPLERNDYLKLLNDIEKITRLFTSHFGLRGVCGVDFVISTDAEGKMRPYVVEINPRYTASMELMEKAYCLNIFSLHLEAVEGRLPEFSLVEKENHGFYGKGIVFALSDVEVKETTGWRDRGIRDIPFPGDRMEKGHPICTVLAEGSGYNECRSALFRMANKIRRETGDIVSLDREP